MKPWRVDFDTGVLYDCDDNYLVYLDALTKDEMCLIEAAPELLEALKDIVELDGNGWKLTEREIGKAKAAIAKAEGKNE